ncbi:MAG: hypothetical protein ABIU05_06390 [Nitrospirales bacterium]
MKQQVHSQDRWPQWHKIFPVIATLASFCIVGRIYSEDMVKRIESIREDIILKSVEERGSKEYGHGRTLLGLNGKRYFMHDLTDCARQIKVVKLTDAIALSSYLRDPDPKIRFIVLTAIMNETNKGHLQSERVAAEQALVWERTAPDRIAWQSALVAALADRFAPETPPIEPTKE